jgi:UDP-N-acetylglucosamine enolpyruvyl transferase
MTRAPATTTEVLEVTGGAPLHGEVTVRGAKNAVPKDMVAALLTGDDCVIGNVPGIQDVEIVDLIALLQKMGAIISLAPDRILRIAGVPRLRGFTHPAMPDRLEVASWACAAIATGGEITVHNAHQHDMMTFLNLYRLVGGEFHVADDGVRFWRASGRLHSTPWRPTSTPGS